MSATGKEFRVSTSVNRATALGNSSGELPNVMYFPTDDSNSIIFNGRIYDLNRLITTPKSIGTEEDLNNYKGNIYVGVYTAPASNNIKNKPSGVTQFTLQVFVEGGSNVQMLYHSNKLFIRAYEGGSWLAWKELGAGGLTSIPKATTSALGGIMLGYTNSGRNYKLELDSNGKAFVNVPWTNTTYNNATTEVSGLMSASDKSKLDGITSSADAVSFSRTLSSGTKIGAITINGTSTDIYAPTAGTSPTYGQATSSTLGLVKIGYPESGKNYPVELNSSGQMYVNVPWTDNNTTYGLATANASGLLRQLNGDASYYMRGDGTWAIPPNTTYSLVGANGSTGLIKNGSSVTNASGYTACPIIGGVPYYKNTTYTNGTGIELVGTAINLKAATSNSIGGVKISEVEITSPTLNGAITTALQTRVYPVQYAKQKGTTDTKILSVSVPWTDTTYDIVTASKNGLISKDSPLVNLAGDTKDSGNQDTIVVCGQDGSLDYSHIEASKIALINESNVWSVYQDFKAGAGNSGSDMRFKKEVEPVTSISESIAKLDIIQYIWEHPDEERIRNTFGVKADQLLELGGIFATMVHSRGDEYKTKWVEYDRFGVLAIKAIQELLKRLEQCETKIAELEAKL